MRTTKRARRWPTTTAEPPDYLFPGAAHPYPPISAADLARHYQVGPDLVSACLAEGLPADDDGRIDPFAACNHLTRRHLDRVPVLSRRWRRYQDWFAPFLAGGPERTATYAVRCRRRAYFPEAPRSWSWWLPRPPDGDLPQRVEAEDCRPAVPAATRADTGYWRIDDTAPGDRAELVRSFRVTVREWRVCLPGSLHRRLREAVEPVVAGIAYGYHHHLPHGLPAEAGARWPEGSCLDCACLAGEALRAAGCAVHLVGGLVADSAIANPHFWLLVDCDGLCLPVDPSLPAIVRLLGGDWRTWLDAYVGGVDAGRIWLAVGPSPVTGLPGGPAFSLACGELLAVDAAGRRRNAWPCLDWVGGDCACSVERLPG